MNTTINKRRHSLFNRLVSTFVAFTFIFSMVLPPQFARAQAVSSSVLNLPLPGTMVTPTPGYDPALIKGMTIHPENPLEFDFIVNSGDSGVKGDALKEESRKLIKYFLASLTVPEDEMWVNLSPYEGDRIISTDFGKTEMGRDLLAQDYILKQLTSSLIYPEKEIGKEFWDRVYKKAEKLYGTTDIPINTFNKVWIVPDKAVVFQNGESVYILQSHLKVMLEEDYVALEKNMGNKAFNLDSVKKDDAQIISGVSSEVVRNVLIPEIEKEVNEGKNFANLRQVFNSGILAAWFKQNLKESLLGQVYVDKSKVKGVDVKDKEINQKIYKQYLEAFKKGVFNYIKDDYDTETNDVIPRKYFSGGTTLNFAMLQTENASNPVAVQRYNQLFSGVETGKIFKIKTEVTDVGVKADFNPAMAALEKQGTKNYAMLTSQERSKLSENFLANMDEGVIKDPEQIKIIKKLIYINETKLLNVWDEPGVNDQKKIHFLNQMIDLDASYPGGLEGYKKNVKELLASSKRGDNPFEGFWPHVPKGDNYLDINDKYMELSELGLKNANKIAVVLVAGGVGDRLGYNGIKVGIPLDIATERTYLENYSQNILALQKASNKINKENRKIPLIIMTSNATHEAIIKLLLQNKYFGLDGLSINPTKDQVLAGDVKQIVILKQGAVPAVNDNQAGFLLDENDKYLLQTKPHGHGDVHSVVAQASMEDFVVRGDIRYTIFIQDTNGQVFNALLVGLANSLINDFDLNFLTVSRDAGEAAGAIVDMQNEQKGLSITMNVEYNELGPVLKSTVNPLGDVADPVTGKSPYPANLNVFIVKNSTYAKKIKETGGIFGEFINPKYADDNKTQFKKPTRSETMMQDYAKSLTSGEKVGFTNFAKRDVFSPVKNSISEALSKVKSNNYPDSMATGEFDYYKYNRKLFKLAGVDIDVEGKERITQKIPYSEGAKVILYPNFALTPQDVISKVSGGKISENSVIILNGENIKLNNLNLNGSLVVKISEGVSLVIDNYKVQNDGWRYVDLTEDEMLSKETPQALKIRGYKLVKHQMKEIVINKPGNYFIGADGVLMRDGVALSAAEILDAQNSDLAMTVEKAEEIIEQKLPAAERDLVGVENRIKGKVFKFATRQEMQDVLGENVPEFIKILEQNAQSFDTVLLDGADVEKAFLLTVTAQDVGFIVKRRDSRTGAYKMPYADLIKLMAQYLDRGSNVKVYEYPTAEAFLEYVFKNNHKNVISVSDNAMTQQPQAKIEAPDTKGGIDLDPKLLDLQIKRDANGVPLPMMQQPIQQMNIQGFIPIIINITPITELPMLIGYDKEQKNKKDTSTELGFGPMDKDQRLELSKVN